MLFFIKFYAVITKFKQKKQKQKQKQTNKQKQKRPKQKNKKQKNTHPNYLKRYTGYRQRSHK